MKKLTATAALIGAMALGISSAHALCPGGDGKGPKSFCPNGGKTPTACPGDHGPKK